MLRQLHISGLGVIDDVDLEPHAGLTVLTGETGAGKTMITVGLAIALGGRGSASLVRAHSNATRVQARFDAPDAAGDWAEDDEVILARTVSADGKSTARIGGQLTTASALAELGAQLLEIHGQHQSLRLLEPSTQTAFLDRAAGDEHIVALGAFRESFERLLSARSARDELAEAARARERELDLLAYQVREIEAAAPRDGETLELETEEARLGHLERLRELTAGAEDALAGDAGAGDALAGVADALDAASDLDASVAPFASRARAIAAESRELVHDLRGYRETLAADPGRLGEVAERLATLRTLRRKYGATDADVLGFLAEASARLDVLAGADDRLAELEAEVAALETEVIARSRAVTTGRTIAAAPLAAALEDELRELGMPSAEVEVVLQPLAEPDHRGAERVELRLRAASEQPALALAKGASGGELSRVMLACRSVLADLDDVPTLVFDEIDAGIGGQAGLAVGRRLAGLATARQVIVVTHLPQIACFADLHVRVRKERGTASIEPLGDDERLLELSRMLAGLEPSDAAVSHAEELLVEAARVRSRASDGQRRPARARADAKS